jgi:uncharacterized coiled-coil protein SlyX
MFHSVCAQFQLTDVQEKAIKEKEKELNEVTLKLASAQTYILNLEKRINDMESSILYKKTGPNITTSNDDSDRLISTTLERRLIEIEHKCHQLNFHHYRY